MVAVPFNTLKFASRSEAIGNELVTKSYLDAKLSDLKTGLVKLVYSVVLTQTAFLVGVMIAIVKIF